MPHCFVHAGDKCGHKHFYEHSHWIRQVGAFHFVLLCFLWREIIWATLFCASQHATTCRTECQVGVASSHSNPALIPVSPIHYFWGQLDSFLIRKQTGQPEDWDSTVGERNNSATKNQAPQLMTPTGTCSDSFHLIHCCPRATEIIWQNFNFSSHSSCLCPPLVFRSVTRNLYFCAICVTRNSELQQCSTYNYEEVTLWNPGERDYVANVGSVVTKIYKCLQTELSTFFLESALLTLLRRKSVVVIKWRSFMTREQQITGSDFPNLLVSLTRLWRQTSEE